MTTTAPQRAKNGARSDEHAPDGSCCHLETLRYPDGRIVVVVSEPCETHREGQL